MSNTAPADPAAHASSEPHDASDANTESRGQWQRLDTFGQLMLIATILIAAKLVYARVIWAPCYGDPGEVQITVALGAVGHPPGQAGVISILRAFVLAMPFFRADFVVSGVNATFGLAIVGMLMLLMLRTGANPVAAAIASLLFLVDDQYWHLTMTPETYATCIILLVGSIWSFLSWLHDPPECGHWKFWLAVTMFFYLVASRGPTLAMSASFLAAMIFSSKGRAYWSSHYIRRVLIMFGIGVACIAFTLGSLWVRDVPDVAYNYLDVAHPGFPDDYPVTNTTTSDKVDRLIWLVSAKQFDYMFEPTLDTMTSQMRWLIYELGWQYWPIMAVAFAVIGIGAVELWRRNREVATFVLLMIPGGLVPILLIWVISHTTMLPNLLFPLAWLMGMGLTRVLAISSRAVWNIGVVTVVAFCVWLPAEASLIMVERHFDASEYLATVDFDAMPQDATILTDSHHMGPLVMTQINSGRDDIDIELDTGRWTVDFVRGAKGRVFSLINPGHQYAGETKKFESFYEMLLPTTPK